MESSKAELLYPRVLRRVQGALIDGLVIPVAAVGAIVALGYAGIGSGYLKGMVALFLILLLEPLAVSFTGGSIGHHVVGMRVRRISRDEKIGILSALVRFVVKTLAGLPAFLVVLTTRRRQALHDVAARSVVVYKRGGGVPSHEILPELSRAEEHRAYTSVGRRLLVIVAYWAFSYLLLSIAALALCANGKCQAPIKQ
jgi:uncharacterized RDD family membrane protein YckC